MEPSLHISGAAPRPAGEGSARSVLARPADLDRPTLRTPMDVPEVDLAFADVLDLINPLQHIPLVSSIYRAITGDEIAGPAKVLGGALFGGPLGFMAGIVDAVSSQIAGDDLGEIALAALFGVGEQGAATALAANDPVDAEPTPPVAVAAAPVPEAKPEPAAFRAVAKAPVAPVDEQPLTGDAALQALAADLRSPGVAGGAAVRPLPPSVGTGVDARPIMAPPPRSAFAVQMLDGLDKYKALAAERAAEQATAPRLLDRAL